LKLRKEGKGNRKIKPSWTEPVAMDILLKSWLFVWPYPVLINWSTDPAWHLAFVRACCRRNCQL